jgi:hypothetical protein
MDFLSGETANPRVPKEGWRGADGEAEERYLGR